jgi:hypothetical protein
VKELSKTGGAEPIRLTNMDGMNALITLIVRTIRAIKMRRRLRKKAAPEWLH